MTAPIQQWSARRALELPATELTHPFGDEWDVFKVLGRVFALHSELDGQAIVTLKAAPADAEALRLAYPEITPGYHMNKTHWITLRAGENLTPDFVAELVTESYLQVVEHSIPKRDWPVDPSAFIVDPKTDQIVSTTTVRG